MWMKWCWKKYVRKNPLGKTAFYFIDSKDMYFRKTDTNNKHTSFRTHKEAQELFFSKIEAHGDFVLASVKGDCKQYSFPFFSMLYGLRLQRIFGCGELKSVFFRNLLRIYI